MNGIRRTPAEAPASARPREGSRLADVFETRVKQTLLQQPPRMAHLILAAALEFARARGFGDLTEGRPGLAAWLRPISALPSLRATAPPISR